MGRPGFFTRTGSGSYALNPPTSEMTLTNDQILNFAALPSKWPSVTL
jgi:hypothetical protein